VKVTIVGGGGGVGSATAFNLLISGERYEIVLVDPRAEMATSHLMDFDQVVELFPESAVRSGTATDIADADVLVVAAAAPLVLNTSRLVHLHENAAILDEVGELIPSGWPGVAIVVTNPVDPLVTRLYARLGGDRRRILGYTLNDNLRLRTGVARALGVAPGAVDAWTLGEHGDSTVPLLDRISVEGEAVTLEPGQAAAAVEYAQHWYVRHVALDSGRSSTWASGLGIARMVRAIGADAGELWPASLVLEGEYGVRGVAISVPVELGRAGALRIHEWDLGEPQLTALRHSADRVAAAIAELAGDPGV
jgi:malate dehydrogenase